MTMLNSQLRLEGRHYLDWATFVCDPGYEYADGTNEQKSQCVEHPDTGVAWLPFSHNECIRKLIYAYTPISISYQFVD